ncbi:MAG TPA: class I SAM-dependent methyltransferase, partial [Jatrophihabitantaceae bacterium]|nr:class I SAM-dependent methyltransferase [Jatrophihabitantaceae bacterium]
MTTDRRYDVARCVECGLRFTVPRPTPAELETFYGEQYFTRGGDTDTAFGYERYDENSLAAINARRTWDDLKAWGPAASAVPLKRLLDVGAATGEFGARAAAEGWDVVACEVGDTAREHAAAKGLQTIATIDSAEGPFGLITMFHVLEHLIEPTEALRTSRELIDKDGVLAIELPQWRSAGRIVRRARWKQLRPPEHINFFSTRSIAVALQRTGWTVEFSATPYPRADELAVQALKNKALRPAADYGAKWLAGRLGLGGYLRVIARPA